MENLWMKALQYPEPEVLSDGGRRLWWLIVPVHRTYLYISHYIIRKHPWARILHQTNANNVLQRNWLKSVWRAISRLWSIPERYSCMQTRRRQLGGEPPVHSRSVVKISYNIKMTTQKIRSHDDRRSATWICSSSPTMIYSIVQIYMKPSQCSRLQYKHYIIHDKVQKGENDFFNTYLHKMSRQAYILVKPLFKMKELAYSS